MSLALSTWWVSQSSPSFTCSIGSHVDGSADRLGHSGPSYLSQLANAHRPVTEKTARKFEQSLGLREGWLDEDTHEPVKTLPACPAILGQVVQAVSEEMESQHVSVDPPRMAAVVTMVYEHAQPLGHVDPDYVRKVVQLTH